MDTPCLPPRQNPKKPTVPTPPGACDAHFHLFGPMSRFPYSSERAYTPPEAPLEALLRLHGVLGFQRGVVIQGNAHGTDNSALLDALRREPGRLRGAAIVKDTISAAELRRFADAGVRALRFHHISGIDKSKYSSIGMQSFEKLAPMMADLGLHVQMLIDSRDLPDVMPSFRNWTLPIVVDHMGQTAAVNGIDNPGFQAMRRLLAEGRIWVKLSGAYRISNQFPDYRDARPFHDGLVAANPDQVIWGTDWPHPRLAENMPDTGRLLDLFNAWTPDPALRRKILVDNPARLFGLG